MLIVIGVLHTMGSSCSLLEYGTSVSSYQDTMCQGHFDLKCVHVIFMPQPQEVFESVLTWPKKEQQKIATIYFGFLCALLVVLLKWILLPLICDLLELFSTFATYQLLLFLIHSAGNGILDVRRMLKFGINVCLATGKLYCKKQFWRNKRASWNPKCYSELRKPYPSWTNNSLDLQKVFVPNLSFFSHVLV